MIKEFSREHERQLIIYLSAFILIFVFGLQILYDLSAPNYKLQNYIRLLLIIIAGVTAFFLPRSKKIPINFKHAILPLLVSFVVMFAVWYFTPEKYPNLNVKLMPSPVLSFAALPVKKEDDYRKAKVVVLYHVKYLLKEQSEKRAILQNERLMVDFEKPLYFEWDQFGDLGYNKSTPYFNNRKPVTEQILNSDVVLEHGTLFSIVENVTWGDLFEKVTQSTKAIIQVKIYSMIDNKEVSGDCNIEAKEFKEYILTSTGTLTVKCL